jgi:hypothetical protein
VIGKFGCAVFGEDGLEEMNKVSNHSLGVGVFLT